ncbi:MAG: hypothetical protein JSV58_00745 [Candidatus Bathyarchaeota archaeon]|nr:MAG: hypothetical protein JSV58_00745 [Candidatus Bathyarchaeota archaeon]
MSDKEVMKGTSSVTCPGIKKFIRPVPAYFKCPSCGGNVEIWSDEDAGICIACKRNIDRPEKQQSCLNWCEYADKCKEIIRQQKH